MTLQIRVSADDPTPPYEQLRRQIVNARPPSSRPTTGLSSLAESLVGQARLTGASPEPEIHGRMSGDIDSPDGDDYPGNRHRNAHHG